MAWITISHFDSHGPAAGPLQRSKIAFRCASAAFATASASSRLPECRTRKLAVSTTSADWSRPGRPRPSASAFFVAAAITTCPNSCNPAFRGASWSASVTSRHHGGPASHFGPFTLVGGELDAAVGPRGLLVGGEVGRGGEEPRGLGVVLLVEGGGGVGKTLSPVPEG